jgi:hypothetical protein
MGGLGQAATVASATNAPVEFPPMLFVFELDGKQEFPKAAPTPTPRGRGGPPPPGQAPAPEQIN